jgi:DNA-binding response OmpR family regulator
MAGSGLNLGVIALASGLKICLESDEDPSAVIMALRSSGLFTIQWERAAHAVQLEERLLREARWSKPDAWLIVRVTQPFAERVRTLRAEQGAVPILVLSSGDDRTETAALRSGADAFCRWPQESAVLGIRLHALIRRASGSFRIATRCLIELLPQTRQLRVDECLVQLSPPEYALLRVLDSARNEWVHNNELWAIVGPRRPPSYDSSLLRMHVLRVRRKLGAWSFVLRTERGKGTMLTDRVDLTRHNRRAC